MPRQLLDNLDIFTIVDQQGCPTSLPSSKLGSKVKEVLRAAKARLLETLEVAIAQALAAVTAHNAFAWFRHRGYGVHQL